MYILFETGNYMQVEIIQIQSQPRLIKNPVYDTCHLVCLHIAFLTADLLLRRFVLSWSSKLHLLSFFLINVSWIE